ncbi:unnamed protein product [Urochloa humidicola]
MAPLSRLVELEHDQQLSKLVEDWDFVAGKRFQDKVFNDLGAAVHHPFSSPAGSFSLLAIFRRYTFRLTVESKVGFMVCDLKRIITDYFDVYFHLWRDGADCWARELKLWTREEEKSWTQVSHKKKQKKNWNKKVSFCEKLV